MALNRIKQFFAKGPDVRFVCEPKWFGVIEPPSPARKNIPQWFKDMPQKRRTPIDPHTEFPVATAKKCHGLFEGMAAGWIFKTASDVDVAVWDNQTKAKWSTRYDMDDMITLHAKQQTQGMPRGDKVVAKWATQWSMRTAAGWSTMFMPPMNHENEIFEVFSASIRTDIYKGFILQPFTFKKDGEFFIPAGTPISQAIPYKRFEPEAYVNVMSDDELEESRREVFKIYLNEGHYKRLCTNQDREQRG